MKIVYLDSALSDLEWLDFYYNSVFHEGAGKARARLVAVHQLLSANPFLGRPSNAREGVRVLPVSKTPFKLIYRITKSQIEILRLWDERQGRSE